MAPNLKYKIDGSGRLHQRVAIVTGASSGMGRGIALALAREGAYVVCSDLVPDARSDGFEEDKTIPTHTVIENNGGKALFTKCDMGKTKEIFELIAFTVKVGLTPSFDKNRADFLTRNRNLERLIFLSTMPASGCRFAILSKRQTNNGMP